MLLIFWDIREIPRFKEKIATKLEAIEYNTRKFFNNSLKVKIIFTDSSIIRQLNKTYRKLDKETDVLTFAELDTNKKLLKEKNSLGEIYVNYDWIKKDIKHKNPDFRLVSALFIHGYLHLLGYDHEKDRGEMEKIENILRRKFCLV